MAPDDRTPVIVAAADLLERWTTIDAASDPLSLMAQAVRRAELGRLTSEIDSIDVVNLTSWRYRDPPAELAARLGISPQRLHYGPIGGETPVRMIDEAARRIARDECGMALLCGAEAQYSANKARAAGDRLPWPALALRVDDGFFSGYLNPLALEHQITRPAEVYPLFEHAAIAAWGQTPAQGLAESGQIWAGMASIAGTREAAWSPRAAAAADIVTPSPDNRLIAWPYTKRLTANPAVNQAAAIFLTSLRRARELGIADDRLVFVWSGAAANEPRDYLQRDDYAVCPAQRAVLKTLAERLDGRPFDHHELYSCFPVVPKLARRSLGLAADAPMTVTGGHSSFGAPLNNYMTHAAVAMVARLQGRTDALGLLYGQGEFMTKHHGLILSSAPPTRQQVDLSSSVQSRADRGRHAPALDAQATGVATLETFTIVYGRDGQPQRAAVIARDPAGRRTMATVAVDDGAAIDILTSLDRSPIGLAGIIRTMADGQRRWHIQGA